VNRRARSASARGDDGFALLFLGLTLVVMLGFAAFAVDLGAVYNARRQDQSAADVAALGAAQDLQGSDATIVAQVRTLVEGTLELPAGTLDFNSCGTANVADVDSVDTLFTDASCIARNAARTQLQVRLPTQTYSSIFGSLVGVDGFQHSAFAIAGRGRAGFGGPLPFAMSAGAGGGDGYVCLKTGPGGHAARPCDGPSSGNLGYVDFAFFGDPELGTTVDCSGKDHIPNNIAVGADHELSRYGDVAVWGNAVVLDTAAPCGSVPQPNSVDTSTGNMPARVGSGIYAGTSFSDGKDARLTRTDPKLFDGASSTRSVAGKTLDDNPLWAFIAPTGSDVPDSCERDQFFGVGGGLDTDNDLIFSNLPDGVEEHVDGMTKKERMRKLLQRCLAHYNGTSWDDDGALVPADPVVGCGGNACTDAVFAVNSSSTDSPDLYDIQYTSRFAYVPELTSAFPSGSQTVRIGHFRAVFLQRLLIDCNSNACDYDFEPGVGYNSPGGSSDKADSVTAFVLPANSLPNGLGSDDAPFAVGRNRAIKLLR
jgi:Flp pilus assembly protein TadG